MNVGVKLEISSGGVGRGNDGRKKMSFFVPEKHCLAGGSKETVKQESIFIE